MAFLTTIAEWILGYLLSYLMNKAVDGVTKAKENADKDATNAANTKAYEDAQTRVDRIKSALDLINGSNRTP